MKQHESADGIFYYTEEKNANADVSLCITGYEGMAETLSVPSQIDSYPVKTIGKKAFLGNLYFRHIIFPETIEAIGDWAFSRCYGLRKITVPRREIAFGKQVFQKSNQLYNISIKGWEKTFDRLLAAAVTMLEAEYLLTPLHVGEDKWCKNLDARIMAVLREPEESALKNLVYCAEEDMASKQEACLRELADRKAGIAFLRLIHSEGMEHDRRRSLTEYLRQRTKGCRDESAWEAVKEEKSEKLQYCDILLEIGGIHERNISAVLEDLKEDNVELKAYLLKKWQNRQQAHMPLEALSWEEQRMCITYGKKAKRTEYCSRKNG